MAAVTMSYYLSYGSISEIIILLLDSQENVKFIHSNLEIIANNNLKIKDPVLYQYYRDKQTLPMNIKDTLSKIVVVPQEEEHHSYDDSHEDLIDASSDTEGNNSEGLGRLHRSVTIFILPED